MDSLNFHDIRVEKANAGSRYRRFQRITALFRLVELFVFLIIVSRYSVQFVFPLEILGEYFQRISATLISSRFIFFVGNAIVIVLFLKSGRFSVANGEKMSNFYEEYVELCRQNREKNASEAYRQGGCYEDRKINRSYSMNLDRKMCGFESRRELTRSMTDRCRKNSDCERRLTDEMSSEEFRRTVEAFIARQQRFLREE